MWWLQSWVIVTGRSLKNTRQVDCSVPQRDDGSRFRGAGVSSLPQGVPSALVPKIVSFWELWTEADIVVNCRPKGWQFPYLFQRFWISGVYVVGSVLGVRDTMMKKTEHLKSRDRGGEMAVNRSFQCHDYVQSALTGMTIRNTEEE